MKIYNKLSNTGFWMGGVITAMIAAAAVFAVMLQIEKNTLSDYEKGDVYIATESIPKGQTMTEENIGGYIEVQKADIKLIPETAVTDLAGLNGMTANYNIDRGALLTYGMFDSVSEATEGMEEPVIAGIKAEDVYQLAGGMLRAGDRIHIYGADDLGVVQLKWSNVYVQQVSSGSGAIIKSGDSETVAQRINVYIDKSEVVGFYTEL